MIVSPLVLWLALTSAPPAQALNVFFDVDGLDSEEQAAPPPRPRPRTRPKLKVTTDPAPPPSTTARPEAAAPGRVTKPRPAPKPIATARPSPAVVTTPPARTTPAAATTRVDAAGPSSTPGASTPPAAAAPPSKPSATTTPPAADARGQVAIRADAPPPPPATESASTRWACTHGRQAVVATDDPAQVKAMIDEVLGERAFKVGYRSDEPTKLGGNMEIKITSLGNETQMVMTQIKPGEPPRVIGVSPAMFCVEGQGESRAIRVGLQLSKMTFNDSDFGITDGLIHAKLGNLLPLLLSPTGTKGHLRVQDGVGGKAGGWFDAKFSAPVGGAK